ncbi:ferrous iron transport protein A [candidate division KSB3 bacterium]|uniref:Ferrous iron transport protein A n=1 Tax=candidate division KSB3 bacterium TaxID=2044937 RepID=A0A9D5JTJ5_9BACT|nr:ferrous iron transport protein A [candidate division KSB3 bacterium]MBD3323830.1 ferrous iron transport protein A [candidate division KSB3 bacterium]
MTLKSVAPGSRVIVKKLTGHGAVRRRLMDMGIIPGTEIEVLKVAPLGDPVEMKFKGYNLSLRRDEADMVIVEDSANIRTEDTKHPLPCP